MGNLKQRLLNTTKMLFKQEQLNIYIYVCMNIFFVQNVNISQDASCIYNLTRVDSNN